MKNTLPVLIRIGTLLLGITVGGLNAASSQHLSQPESPTILDYCRRFERVYIQIREQTIVPAKARAEFARIMLGLQERFGQAAAFREATLYRDSLLKTSNYFAFPVRGYTPAAIGGTHGEGYLDKGFDLFDYLVRGSHPAQDIFIADKNQDSDDDRTGRPVDVLSMTNGVVLAVETGWQPGSEYRGGNWVWVYDPIMNGLFYYAHNRRVVVEQGQWVQAGQKLSEMGRTGFNAYKTRSPTHVHVMYLQILPTGLPTPRNTYNWLRKAWRPD